MHRAELVFFLKWAEYRLDLFWKTILFKFVCGVATPFVDGFKNFNICSSVYIFAVQLIIILDYFHFLMTFSFNFWLVWARFLQGELIRANLSSDASLFTLFQGKWRVNCTLNNVILWISQSYAWAHWILSPSLKSSCKVSFHIRVFLDED